LVRVRDVVKEVARRVQPLQTLRDLPEDDAEYIDRI